MKVLSTAVSEDAGAAQGWEGLEGLSPAVELLAEDAGDAPRLLSPTAP